MDFEPEAVLDGLEFSGVDISGRDAARAILSECRLTRVSAAGTVFKHARFVDVEASGLTAHELDLSGATLRGLSLVGSRIGALEAYDGDWSSVSFGESKFEWINLRGSRVQDLEFRDCVIGELDLTGASAKRVAFADCRVDSLTLRGATLRDVDLRGADSGDVVPFSGLSGATLDTGQLIGLLGGIAAELGINLAD